MTPQAEFGPDVSVPEEQEEPGPDDVTIVIDPERLIPLLREPYKSAARNAKIAAGAAKAEWAHKRLPTSENDYWCAGFWDGSHKREFIAGSMQDALIALAEACDAA